MERILIVRLAALGDLVTVSVLLERIRAERPEARVTWLCGASGAELVRLFEGVHEVIVADDERLLGGGTLQQARALLAVWRRLAGRRFDRVLLAHADRRYRALLVPVRARRVDMLDRATAGRTNPIPGRYLGDEYARLLDGPVSRGPLVLRYAPADVRHRLPATPDRPARARRVVLVPGGARNAVRENPMRRWPVERYRRTAERLLELGCTVTLVGNAGDAWVRPHFAALDVDDQIGRLSLAGTLALMRDAALVISHDTGPMHLARLVRVPLLALFGPTMPHQFMVEDGTTRVLWGGGRLACRPCYDGREFAACADNLCMQDISLDEVVAHAAALLGVPHALPAAPAADPVALTRGVRVL